MDNKHLSIGLYEKALPATLHWKEKLTMAQELGFDFLEMSIDETDEKIQRLQMKEADMIALLQDMKTCQLPIGSICLSALRRYALGSENENLCNKGINIAYRAIDLASALGIRMIQLPGYDVYYEPSHLQSRQKFIRNIQMITSYAATKGVLLGFETMENTFMDTVEKARRVIDHIHSPYLQIYPDAGNLNNAMHLYHHKFDDDLICGKGHMIAMHLKETTRGIYRNMNYGEGDCDFDAILLTSFQLQIRRFVCELWYQGEENWKAILKQNRDVMFDHITKCWQRYEEGE